MDPEIIEPRVVTQQVRLTVSHLCVNCFPIQKAGFFIWFGMSLCQECFTKRRKAMDQYGAGAVAGVDKRDYKKTWGEDPIQDAEEV